MTVAELINRAEALQAMGASALLSPNVAILKEEIAEASAAYRSHIVTGRPPQSAPPPRGSAAISSNDLLTYFRSIAASRQQTTSVRAAFFDYATGHFPCRRQVSGMNANDDPRSCR